MGVEDLSREEKAVIFVAGVVDDLERMGMVTSGGMSATPRGIAAFDQLKAGGFVPTDSEIVTALHAVGFSGEDTVRMAFRLVKGWMDGWVQKQNEEYEKGGNRDE